MIALGDIVAYLPDAVDGVVVDSRERLTNEQ